MCPEIFSYDWLKYSPGVSCSFFFCVITTDLSNACRQYITGLIHYLFLLSSSILTRESSVIRYYQSLPCRLKENRDTFLFYKKEFFRGYQVD